jgi:SAM-dependent methyltransferase
MSQRFASPSTPPQNGAQMFSGAAAQSDTQAGMTDLYDHYFACKDYEKRYPAPNAATLEFLLRHGAGKAGRILDFGCGNGRYALALLEATSAHVTGYDISTSAIEEFSNFLKQTPFGPRVRLLTGPREVLAGPERFDVVLLLFGVLSHIGGCADRLDVLCDLRAMMAPQGRLVLTVPSIWRRRPLELLSATFKRLTGRAQDVQAEAGNIEFTRLLGGISHTFFYHLYSVRRLRQELQSCGFEIVEMDAESVLPEWLITQYPAVGRLDAVVSRFLPAFLGYGIRAVVKPV